MKKRLSSNQVLLVNGMYKIKGEQTNPTLLKKPRTQYVQEFTPYNKITINDLSDIITIVIYEFPTHMLVYKCKTKADKYIKINNQNIYNGALNKHSRKQFVENMHNFILSCLPENISIKKYPIKIVFEIHTIKNHGNISLVNGKLTGIELKKSYIPRWDIENLATIWRKTIMDSLVLAKIIPSDSIQYVTEYEEKYVQVEKFEERKIIIKLKPLQK